MLTSRDISLGESTIRLIEAGSPDRPTVLFLHGWPQDSTSWSEVMFRAAEHVHAVAIDLPGIGGSHDPRPDGLKSQLAARVSALVGKLGWKDVSVVGHDAGGMVTYALLRGRTWLRRAAILDTVIPGVDPWDQVVRNPHIWHFAFHAIPDLPETVVRGHEAVYFDYFYRALCKRPEAITAEARARYLRAYSSDAALAQGFAFYRAFPKDAEENLAAARSGPHVRVPLLYVRGDAEIGDIRAYVEGFRKAGVEEVAHAVIPDSGHFTPDEAPGALWETLKRFLLR